jgi:putative cardiolipin synthase
VLLDDLGTAAGDRNLLAVDSHPNIEVRLFNPLAARSVRMLGMLGDFSRVNRRMHNKSFTADNQATIVGGRNIGDEYFEARPDVEFADLDVLAMGPVVGEVSRQFDAYWNSPHAYPITTLAKDPPGEADIAAARDALLSFVHAQRDGAYAQALQASGLAASLAEGRLALSAAQVRVVADDPAKIGQREEDAGPLLLPQLLPEFASLRTELILVSPYFVPGEQGVAHLRALTDRGVKVRVLTNSLASTDVPAVHAGYQRYRRALLDAGVALHELKPTAMHHTMPAGEGKAGLSGSSHASLHAKTLLFDRRAVFIGSMNLDPRSVFTNTEIGVVVDHSGLAALQAEQLVARLPEISYRLEPAAAAGPDAIEWVSIEAGEEVRFTREPQTRAWQRFKIWLYSLLPIEPLL